MPSGAKKRKVAKRKKEQEQEQEKKQQQQLGLHPTVLPTSPTTGLVHPPQGNVEREEVDDDLLSQDGKGTESGSDFASPTERENNHHHIGVEEEEERARAKLKAEGEEKKGKKESGCAGLVDTVNVMEGPENGGSEQPSQSLLPQKTEDEVAKKTEEEVPVVVVEVKKDDVLPPPPSDPVPPTASAEVPISALEAVSVEHVLSEKGEDGAVSGDTPPSVEYKESDAAETVETADPVELSIPLTEEVVQSSVVPVESLNVVASAAEVLSEKSEEKVVLLSEASSEQPDLSSESQHGTENREIVGTTEVVQSTQLERRTSWMSCCGLFDVITGAHR